MAVLHDRLNPTVAEAIERMRARGLTVDLIGPPLPTTELTTLRPAHDLYYVKTSTEPVLSYAAALHAAGAATINPYPRIELLGNKLAAAVELRKAGLPVPETWITDDRRVLAQLLEGGPLVLKPCRGSRGRGVVAVHQASELPERLDAAVVVQRYHRGDGFDRKLYCIGDRVFALKRPWPCATWAMKSARSEPFSPDARLRELVLRCREALGLSLFGLDVVLSEGEPHVVDVNKCAGFLGVPGAPEILCDHLAQACERARRARGPA
jgi:glutathione synthase/RimK-type ligase-like ATP-grasp enzyme